MNNVITERQARQITGGRTPLVPVEYEAAVNALQACVNIDEAKYWSDKADALAAWAKIYRSDDAGRKARQLKLHAFRRMGTLAQELRPKKFIGGTGGMLPGPQTLLVENGLTESHAKAARVLAKASQVDFERAVNSKNPPSLSTARNILLKGKHGCSDAWTVISRGGGSGVTLSSCRSFCRRYKARDLARGLVGDEVDASRKLATEISEWLDEFLQALPKKTKK
jgi:hypothetical protein